MSDVNYCACYVDIFHVSGQNTSLSHLNIMQHFCLSMSKIFSYIVFQGCPWFGRLVCVSRSASILHIVQMHFTLLHSIMKLHSNITSKWTCPKHWMLQKYCAECCIAFLPGVTKECSDWKKKYWSAARSDFGAILFC